MNRLRKNVVIATEKLNAIMFFDLKRLLFHMPAPPLNSVFVSGFPEISYIHA